MKKHVYWFLPVLLLSLTLIISCADGRVEKIQTEIKGTSDKMHSVFESIYQPFLELDREFETFYKTATWENINIDETLAQNPGFGIQANGMWGRSSEKATELGLPFTVITVPADDTLKKKALMLLPMEKKVVEVMKKVDFTYVTFYSFGSKDNIAMGYKPYDYTVLFPLGLNLTVIPSWKETVKKEEAFLFPPTVSMVGLGYIQALNTSIRVNNEQVAYASLGIKIANLSKDLLKDSDSLIVISHSETYVFGATQRAKDELKVEVIMDYDYTKQTKENPAFPEKFKLLSKEQPEGLQKLGELIKPENVGKKDLTVTINGKKYKVFMEMLPAYGDFGGSNYVIGLL